MSRLIVLSNRVPEPSQRILSGGLAIALQQALQHVRGVWLGWNGEIEPQPVFREQLHAQLTTVTCGYTEAQYRQFYSGYANQVLWPALHGRIDLIREQPDDFVMYQAVNAQFAQQLAQIVTPDDVIWVHDYHFLAVAAYCRQLGMRNRIGFFLHIPFALVDQWQAVSQYLTLATQLTDYDLIGVQTEQDARHARHLLPMPHDHIKAYPIGTDLKHIQELLAQQPLLQPTPYQQIIAVDRIDYTKGLLERLHSLGVFLQQHPQWHQRLQLLQIATPCRSEVPSYQQLQQQFAADVASLNQSMRHGDWQPVQCCEGMPYGQLMATFRASPIGWVNSLADGMNLVAKEYVACQPADQPGVLLLSCHAGAAQQMNAAILFDPLDEQQVQQALNQALHMPLEERQTRHQVLLEQLGQFDIIWWRERFLQDLQQTSGLEPNEPDQMASAIPNEPYLL